MAAAVSMQGWRVNQEDAEINIIPFDNDEQSALFAVFDGHGGDMISKFCAKYLPRELVKLDSYKKGNYEQALIDVFYKMD